MSTAKEDPARRTDVPQVRLGPQQDAGADDRSESLRDMKCPGRFLAQELVEQQDRVGRHFVDVAKFEHDSRNMVFPAHFDLAENRHTSSAESQSPMTTLWGDPALEVFPGQGCFLFAGVAVAFCHRPHTLTEALCTSVVTGSKSRGGGSGFLRFPRLAPDRWPCRGPEKGAVPVFGGLVTSFVTGQGVGCPVNGMGISSPEAMATGLQIR